MPQSTPLDAETDDAGRQQAERPPPHEAAGADDYPVREYIGAMALELAQMARWDGDETLGCALDVAARLAAEPAQRPAAVQVDTGPRKRTTRS